MTTESARTGAPGGAALKKIKNIAIAGVGLVGKRHVAALSQLQDSALSAIVDPSAEGRAFAASLGVPCHDKLESLFAERAPDGLVLATNTALAPKLT